MVFGNMGNDCATGVGFHPEPGDGGEGVLRRVPSTPRARTWSPASAPPTATAQSWKKYLPKVFEQLMRITGKLKHYKDVQDFEFTVNNKLYMLQTRNGKRRSAAVPDPPSTW